VPMDLLAPLYAALAVGVQEAAGKTAVLSPADSLMAAVTMEGLLFAAFSVGTKLTETTVEGRNPFYTQGWFGWSIVLVIGLVALAAGASWWEIFGSTCPANLGGFLLELGLALGIVTQPIFAAAINVESKKTPA
jgi:hypothetical protein